MVTPVEAQFTGDRLLNSSPLVQTPRRTAALHKEGGRKRRIYNELVEACLLLGAEPIAAGRVVGARQGLGLIPVSWRIGQALTNEGFGHSESDKA
jgi:hypothetical protein